MRLCVIEIFVHILYVTAEIWFRCVIKCSIIHLWLHIAETEYKWKNDRILEVSVGVYVFLDVEIMNERMKLKTNKKNMHEKLKEILGNNATAKEKQL